MDSKKYKILVVDDSDNNLFLLEEILLDFNYEVFTANGGLEAVEVIRKEEPDLILLDIMMPDYSGYNVMEYMQENKIDTHVIVISARTSKEDIAKAYELGAKFFIRKPLIITYVLDKIAEVLNIES
ncbi:MAG: response regulator [Salinivirgaceae bacterium]|nr:response regulator [Salinivirgaceae bacterium]MDD4745929.1 response regulator [Salinivirgaceae bacterium]